jgi:hypothetical protein
MPTPRKKFDNLIDNVYTVVMDTQYAWAAGFMDGEGTITVKRYKRNGKIVYQPYVSASQADHPGHFEAIQKLQDMFGGSIAYYKAVPPRARIIAWCCVSRNAIEVIRMIRPYMRVKYRNADLLLKYYQDSGKRPKNYRLSENELKARENTWIQMRLLNQKGKLHLQRLSEIASKEDAIV